MQGSVESWNDIPAVGQLSFLNTSHAALPPGLEAYFKAAVSDDTLYVLAVAKDSHVNFGFRPAYNSDCFELFLDPFFTRDTRSDDSSMQLFITAADPAGKTFRSEGKIPAEARPVPVEGGWGVEIAIPLDNAYFRLKPFDGSPSASTSATTTMTTARRAIRKSPGAGSTGTTARGTTRRCSV